MGPLGAKNMKNRLNNAVTTLVGADATVTGNLVFERGCHVGGVVKGDVTASDGQKSELSVAQTGRIEGNARAARMVIEGAVVGDLFCSGTVTLRSTARVEGSIEYGHIEIEKGAVAKGQLKMPPAGGAPISAGSRAGAGASPAKQAQQAQA